MKKDMSIFLLISIQNPHIFVIIKNIYKTLKNLNTSIICSIFV